MRTICTALALTIAVGNLAAQEKLKVGDKAPVFESVDDQGKAWKSTDHVGKKVVVVYFFPADFTGGCTKQACGFRDDFAKLEGKDVTVIAVSGDKPETHAMFKKAYKLPFTMLADEKGTVAKAFGVPTGKGGTITRSPFGEEVKLTRGVTIRRWTFVIDKEGKIAKINPKVNAAADSKDILKFVK